MVKKTSFSIVFLGIIFAMTISVFGAKPEPSYNKYQDVSEPTVYLMMQSMRSHQVQMTNFLNYTLNLDTPGFIEHGGYQVRAKDKTIDVKGFLRWRTAPASYTKRKLDFYCDSHNRGFFTVSLPGGVVGYTRDGRWELDSDNRLVTLSGAFPVLGESGEIYIPEGAEVTCSASGLIYADNDPIDKLRVVVFTDEGREELASVNGVIFVVHGGEPKVLPGEEHYAVRQYHLEENSVLKALIGDVALAKHPYEATVRTTKVVTKLLNSVVQVTN